jgi:hypothetical protein
VQLAVGQLRVVQEHAVRQADAAARLLHVVEDLAFVLRQGVSAQDLGKARHLLIVLSPSMAAAAIVARSGAALSGRPQLGYPLAITSRGGEDDAAGA